MKILIKSIIIAVFFLSCQPSLKKENRLNAIYNFDQVLYIYYDNKDDGGLLAHDGSIIINSSTIKIIINAIDKTTEDIFIIKSVTYNESKTEYKYQTNAGDLIVEMDKNQIRAVRHLTSTATAQFHQEINDRKEPIRSNNETFYEFNSPMLIDKEHIEFAQEIGSMSYTDHNYLYGIVTLVDKDFNSLKIKILKANQNSIEDLGYDISGLEWSVEMDKINYLENNEMCEICAVDFKNLIIPGRKLKFAMVEGCPDCGTSMNGVWFLTYAKEFKDN